MAQSRVLTRLKRLRQLEEERSLQDLQAAVAERDRIGRLREQASEQRMEGRRHFAKGVLGQDPIERLGGLLAMEQARRVQSVFDRAYVSANDVVDRQRAEFLRRRMGRRQVEILAERERQLAAVEQARREQRMLDDWYARRDPLQRSDMPPRT